MSQTDTGLAGLTSPFDGALAGAATGVGSLPHRDARAAAEFSLRENELPMIPSLPRRSPAESHDRAGGRRYAGASRSASTARSPSTSIGSIRMAPVITDLAADGFGGFRAFLDLPPPPGSPARPSSGSSSGRSRSAWH